MPNDKRLGQYLLEAGLITEEQLQSALDHQRNVDEKIGEVLIDRGLITEKELVKFLSRQTGYMVVNLDNYSVESEAIQHLTEEQARNYCAVPIASDGDKLTVAMQDPFDLSTVDDLSMVTDREIEPVIATRSEIDRYIEKAYQSTTQSNETTRPIRITGSAPGEYEELTAPEVSEDDRSADNVINRVLRDALENRASNVHFNPKSKKVQLQFRIDNVIHHYSDIPSDVYDKVHSRLFMVAEQTGERSDSERNRTIRIQYGNEDVILRLEDAESRFGRKLMIELHRENNYTLNLDELGMDRSGVKKLKKLLDVPRGLLLFSGPIHSGRTSSLYAALRYLCRRSTSPITIEDPIKYDIEFCPQTEVGSGDPSAKIQALDEVLRTDPDLLVVTDIDQSNVAKRVVQASLRGRTVLASCSGENATDVLYQFANDPAVNRSALVQALVGVVNQRLVRVPKDSHLEVFDPHDSLLEELGLPDDRVYYRVSKDDMGPNHYDGMTGLFQILPFREELKTCVLNESSYQAYREASKEMVSLRAKGVEKIKEGVTTIKEVLEATYRDDLMSGREIHSIR